MNVDRWIVMVMTRSISRAVSWSPIVFSLVLISSVNNVAWADGLFVSKDRLLIQTSAISRHYESRPEHNNHQKLIGIEWQAPSHYRFDWQKEGGSVRRMPFLREVSWVVGGASFLNSFSQRSTYLYGGGRYDLYASGQSTLYVKGTIGLLNGYRGDYQNKIPFNRYGTAPAVLPAFGFQYRRVGLEVIPFGAAGVMVNLGVYLF